MKIRLDFVTNSSSTSFVLICYDDFVVDNFIEAIGVKQESVFKDIYVVLFESIKKDLNPAREFTSNHRWNKSHKSFNDFITELFSNDTLERIIKAEEDGYNVYMGELSSDENEIECFFCTDSFIIDDKKFFFDGTNAGW